MIVKAHQMTTQQHLDAHRAQFPDSETGGSSLGDWVVYDGAGKVACIDDATFRAQFEPVDEGNTFFWRGEHGPPDPPSDPAITFDDDEPQTGR